MSPLTLRTKACELAAQCVAGQFVSGEISAQKLMSLCVFFESYIAHGADRTEEDMHLLEPRLVDKLKVVAGGKL